MSELTKWLKSGDVLNRLLVANTLVFVLLLVYHIVCNVAGLGHPFGEDLRLAAPADLHVMLRRPWSVVTHMFTHIEFGHFIINMIMLYSAGRLFRFFLSEKALLTVYLLGGLWGFAMFLLASNFVSSYDSDDFILGASAAVMAVILTIGVLQPNYNVKLFGLIDMPLKWLCVLLVLLDLVSIRKDFSSGGHFGHLGGALFGIYYAWRLKNGKIVGTWLEKFIDKLKGLFSRKSNIRVEYNSGRPKSDDQYNAERKQRQDRVDVILDKISKAGYDSLSREEKDFLFKHSQK
jgi:membrane associated rhomboid family serine protease